MVFPMRGELCPRQSLHRKHEWEGFECEVFYLIADEETQTKLQISQDQYDHMLKNAAKVHQRLGHGIQVMPQAARMTRKVYKRAFLGNELLQQGPAPIKGKFSWASPASSTVTTATGSA